MKKIKKRNYQIFKSPLGKILIVEKKGKIEKLQFYDSINLKESIDLNNCELKDSHLMEIIKNQIDDYFKGKRYYFDLPLDINGTKFQIDVWNALRIIRYGDQWSYKKLSNFIGRP